MLILFGFIASLLCLKQSQVASITKTQSSFVLITVTPNGLVHLLFEMLTQQTTDVFLIKSWIRIAWKSVDIFVSFKFSCKSLVAVPIKR